MSEAEWGELRRELCTQFSEDIVQKVLCDLYEFLSKGGICHESALYWCRKAAYHDRADEIRHKVMLEDAQPFLEIWTRHGHQFPEQELIFLEKEILDRLSKPQDRSGKPASATALRKRKQRAKQRSALAA